MSSNVTIPGGCRPVDSLRAIARSLRQRVQTDHVTPDQLLELCDSLEGIAMGTEAELVKAAALPLSSAEVATLRGNAHRRHGQTSSGNVTQFPRRHHPSSRPSNNGDFDNAS